MDNPKFIAFETKLALAALYGIMHRTRDVLNSYHSAIESNILLDVNFAVLVTWTDLNLGHTKGIMEEFQNVDARVTSRYLHDSGS